MCVGCGCCLKMFALFVDLFILKESVIRFRLRCFTCNNTNRAWTHAAIEIPHCPNGDKFEIASKFWLRYTSYSW